MLNLLKIKAMRKILTKETSTKAVIALVMSHLEYANRTQNQHKSTTKSAEYNSKNSTEKK